MTTEVTTDAGNANTAATETATGQRLRKAFMLRMLADKGWILKNVVAAGPNNDGRDEHGKMIHKIIGRVFGHATGFKRKTNIVNDKEVDSVVLTGVFEITSLLTGETMRATGIYLPMAYAEHVEHLLKQPGTEMVVVDTDIGIEATGKAIPYEWTVSVFNSQDQIDPLAILRNRRRIPLPNATGVSAHLPAPAPVAALEAPKTIEHEGAEDKKSGKKSAA